MNWDSIAAVAELLGAIGVIASLAYLARQVNSGSKQARQAAIQSLQAQMNNVWTQMSANEITAEIFATGSKGLSRLEKETDKLQFSALMLSIFRPYEEIFHYRKSGLVDDWSWESISSQCHALMGTPGFVEWWELRGDWFSSLFQDHIAELLDELPEYKRWTSNSTNGVV
jgi:hypothetical protein